MGVGDCPTGVPADFDEAALTATPQWQEKYVQLTGSPAGGSVRITSSSATEGTFACFSFGVARRAPTSTAVSASVWSTIR